jgi:hypothetical protein
MTTPSPTPSIEAVVDQATREDWFHRIDTTRDECATQDCLEWLRTTLGNLATSIRDSEQQRIREEVKKLGHQQDDDTIWCNMDEVLASLTAPHTVKGNEQQ